MSNKITIQRVAELANVSKSTVSRVLNDYPHVRPHVRARVQRVIGETGYQPNNIARLLASDRSSIIGLVISSDAQMVFRDPYFPALTEAVSTSAAAKDLVMALFVSHSEKQVRHSLSGIIAAGLFDGLILTADFKGDEMIPLLRAGEIPFVFIGRPGAADGIHYIDADNRQGGYLATSHLIKLGYRRIATIASAQNSAGDDRLSGYKQALAEHGMPICDALIAIGDYSLGSGYRGMKALLPRQPDAVFVASDTMALGALRALREAGRRVPADVALVSHDDLPPAAQADPPLTTIRQTINKTGARAVETLAQVINEGEALPLQQIVLPVELVLRASCGALQKQSTA